MSRVWLTLAVVIGLAPAASARQIITPTPVPIVTAERETWFLDGSSLTYEGGTYAPSGAKIHFLPNEMVRTGSYRGIPLYQRTTIEPYSVVFVPLPGGVMQPYERRRVGELTGTVGSTTPGFPIGPSTGPGSGTSGMLNLPQAAGPPMTIPFSVEVPPTPPPAVAEPAPAPIVATPQSSPSASAPAGRPIGTSGRALGRQSPGRNGVFVEFDQARWFSQGPATLVDATRFVRVGDYHGVPVYRDPNGPADVIYVPLMRDAPDVAAPFQKQPPPREPRRSK